MPDQTRLTEPHPKRYSREHRPLGDLHGPHSPSNSDSPLSLVVRKEDEAKISHGESPGRSSSGYSDGSYGSSPNRSPRQEPAGYEQQAVKIAFAQDDKPLSLVIRKNLAHFQDPNANVPAYTVHHAAKGPKAFFNPVAGGVTTAPGADIVASRQEPQSEPVNYRRDSFKQQKTLAAAAALPAAGGGQLPEEQNGYRSGEQQDSGAEDCEGHQTPGTSAVASPAAVHGQQPVAAAEERVQEDEDEDYGDPKALVMAIEPEVTISPVAAAAAGHEEQQADEEDSRAASRAAGIKIKDFARLFENEPGQQPAACDNKTSHVAQQPPAAVGGEVAADDVSDVSSEVSSVDTWSSSLVEGKPYTYGSDVVIRRISRSSNGEPVYQCDFCDKLFANKHHLQSHLVTHTGERAFNCKVCNKTFGRKSTLRAHMTTHTKKSNFMCPVCEKACNDNNSLEEHMRMHTGEKPFVCTICSKAYARKSHLNVHYRVHTGERPFVCHHCDKDFTEKRFLNDHLQTAHNGVEGPLKCPNCAREFAYKTSLKQHLKKQMCERNMNRASGNSQSGNISKQFQCPFCDKSYSWKQTLKQHVSMYHRNKIHTDEFWRYELTKNRRNVMDEKVNEDLWKKQLGKHADEHPKKGGMRVVEAAARAPPSEEGPQGREDEEKWREQIKRISTIENNAQLSAEMKLLALQSLQNSLNFISMAGPQLAAMSNLQRLASLHSMSEPRQPPASQPPVVVKTEPAAHQESYLTLLAKIAQKESEERKMESAAAAEQMANNNSSGFKDLSVMGQDLAGKPRLSVSEQQQQQQQCLPMLPVKEECPAKRTQMWLQQVNKYRHKQPKEELDANHEQLWEEQISRVKKNPVKSPLEPVEITIEDDGESSGRRSSTNSPPQLKAVRAAETKTSRGLSVSFSSSKLQAPARQPSRASFAGVSISQVGVLPPPPEGDEAAEQHPPAVDHEAAVPLHLGVPAQVFPSDGRRLVVRSGHSTPRDQSPAARRESLAASPAAALPPPPAAHEGGGTAAAREEEATVPIVDDSSMLKNLLLDRVKRKRSLSVEKAGDSNNNNNNGSSPRKCPAGGQQQQSFTEPQDILRKRLLGWVDPPSQPQQQQQQQANKVPSRRSHHHHQEGEAPADLREDPGVRQPAPAAAQHDNSSSSREERKEVRERKDNTLTYANTSVLKHLLYRYTGMTQ